MRVKQIQWDKHSHAKKTQGIKNTKIIIISYIRVKRNPWDIDNMRRKHKISKIPNDLKWTFKWNLYNVSRLKDWKWKYINKHILKVVLSVWLF